MIKTTKEICASCNQTVYPTEKMGLEGMIIHKNCFICQHCKRKLTVGNFAAVNGQIFCKPHYLALFKEHGGRYDKAFGAFQSGGSGRNLATKAEADESTSELNQSTAAASVASEAANERPSVLLDTSVNNNSALDISAISQASEDSTVNSVKARKEALERKSSLGSTTGAATSSSSTSSRLSGSTSPVKSIASAFEKQTSSSHLDKTAEPPTKKPPTIASSSSVRSLAGALDKVNIVSKLGMSYSKPASSSTTGETEQEQPSTASSSQAAVTTAEEKPSAAPSDESEGSSGLTHATIARPMIPSMKRRQPTVDKGLFTASPMVSEKKRLETDDVAVEEEEDVSSVDVSAAFIHPQKVAELRVVLKSAHGLFGELEAKKKALQVLIKQKKQIIQKLKQSSSSRSASSVVNTGNPNSAGDEEEEEEVSTEQPQQKEQQVVIEDEDAFLAIQMETEGDLEGAKRHHLLAFERAIIQDLTKESNARSIGGFASFMVRHELSVLLESDELAQKVSDAFDALETVASVSDSCMAEKAVFLSRVIHDTDEALDAFRKAYQLFPQDAELICNYAQFLNKVVAREAIEEGNEAEARELKNTAACLYREALTLQPEADVVRCNLGALLVQLSKTGEASEEERNTLLMEAKEQLEMATKGTSGSATVMALYNLACVQSSLHLVDECRSTLERVLDMAPQCKGDMAEDPDFENVKDQDWFKLLVA